MAFIQAQTSILQWYQFALGVLIALILRMTGVPPLAFALGMYLPMELNTPVLLGGILAWFVGRERSADDATVKARQDRGILVASGLVAGGAIMGVIDAAINTVIKESTGSLTAKELVHLLPDVAFEGIPGEMIGTLTLLALYVFVVAYSRRAKPVRE